MKNWKLKISAFLFLILIVVGLYSTNTQKAFANECGDYADEGTKSGKVVSDICYDLQKITNVINSGKAGDGTDLSEKQLKLLKSYQASIQSNYNSAKELDDSTSDGDLDANYAEIAKYGTLTASYYDKSLEIAKTNDGTASNNTYQAQLEADKGSCIGYTTINVSKCLSDILGYASYYILVGVSYFVGLCGLLFDAVLKYTVVNIKSSLEIVPIEQGWVLFRDLGNFVFIFVLVYIAIRTILGLDNGDTKILIRNVIIIGLLVNFSLFFTKFLIDISNVFSIVFYNKMVGTSSSTAGGAIDTINSFSARFVQPLGIPTIPGGGPSSDAFVALVTKSNSGFDRTANIVIYTLGGSIFLIFVAFSFLYASVLFFIRYLAIIFIMIVSPLAFLPTSFHLQENGFMVGKTR